VRAWLIALFVLLVALIAVGGATRLTDSGLSITEWRPVLGALPPLSDADWQAEFALYQATPEYQLQNRGMSMAEFQVIYWWEWGHRQLARFIGLVWAVGFLGFAVLRKMPPGWWPRLLLLGVLGGLQGAIGWWMVASGLVGDRGRCRALPAGHPSGAGVPDPRADRLVCDEAVAAGARSVAGAPGGHRRRGALGRGAGGAGLRADPARRAGGRARCRAQLYRLAADAGRVAAARHVGRWRRPGAICSKTRAPCSSTIGSPDMRWRWSP
jgi:hypothetical protein